MMTDMLRRLLATAALSLTFAVPFAVAAPVAADDELGPSVPGEFIVELKPDADSGAVNRAVGGVRAPERLSAASSLWRFTLSAATDPIEGTKRIRNTSNVVDAQPNTVAELPEFAGGRVRYWSDLAPPDPTAAAAAAAVDQPALGFSGLPAGASGAGIVVAVLDSGLDMAHPSFAGAVAAGGVDVVDNDPDPAEVADGIDSNGNGIVDEAFGHGTYVAGIVRIVAADASILPVRIIDSDGMSSAWLILVGLDRAATGGADVVNMSLGGRQLGAMVGKVLEAYEKAGLVMVAAAGNSASIEMRYPAAFDSVVGVTAIDGTTGRAATFANTGSWIDVAAPGVGLVSAYPGDRYARWGGTSASTPVVAGALAAIRGEMPDADVDDVVDRLTSTAIDDGLSNVCAYGRVDIAVAVARAG